MDGPNDFAVRILGTAPSLRGDLSPSLVALLNNFAHIGSWANLEQRPNRAVGLSGMIYLHTLAAISATLRVGWFTL
jgi:hypothetical protein